MSVHGTNGDLCNPKMIFWCLYLPLGTGILSNNLTGLLPFISPSSTNPPLRSTRLKDPFPLSTVPFGSKDTKIGVASRSKSKFGGNAIGSCRGLEVLLSLMMMSSFKRKGLFKSSLAGNLSAAEARQLSMKLLTSASLTLERATGFTPCSYAIIAPFIYNKKELSGYF